MWAPGRSRFLLMMCRLVDIYSQRGWRAGRAEGMFCYACRGGPGLSPGSLLVMNEYHRVDGIWAGPAR